MAALSKIEVICDMSKFAAIKKELSELKVGGMTFTQVLGCGVEKGTREYEVDENYEMELLPKIEVSVVVETDRVKRITDELLKTLYTGHIGDGKIFVYSHGSFVTSLSSKGEAEKELFCLIEEE